MNAAAADLPTQIKGTRRKLGLSQSQAAVAWNVPLKTLQKWEQGIREPQGLALDALRQKLADASAGDAPADAKLQDEPPRSESAPKAERDDATPDSLVQLPPTPTPEITSTKITASFLPVATPEETAQEEDDGNEWLPYLPPALAVARFRARMKSDAPAASDTGWGVPARACALPL